MALAIWVALSSTQHHENSSFRWPTSSMICFRVIWILLRLRARHPELCSRLLRRSLAGSDRSCASRPEASAPRTQWQVRAHASIAEKGHTVCSFEQNCVTSRACAIGCANECDAEANESKTNPNPRAKSAKKSRQSGLVSRLPYSLLITCKKSPVEPNRGVLVRLKQHRQERRPNACRWSRSRNLRRCRRQIQMRSCASPPRRSRRKLLHKKNELRVV